MDESTDSRPEEMEQMEVPMGQRLFERPFLLLLLGLAVMFVFYTIWGMVEIYSLPDATLP